jgi:histidinol dehydrogenase
VRFELITADEDARVQASALRELVPTAGSVAERVAEIIADVQAAGDRVVIDLTERFDCPGATLDGLAVPPATTAAALAALPAEIKHALEASAANIRAVALAWDLAARRSVEFDTHTVTLRREPVRRAAVYVPGGRAPYPSTVLMGAVTAASAGVAEVVVCSPPRADGDIDPAVLAACQLTGVSEVLRMGGAQAIAALALGTETVRPVDVIVGPGNLYVQEAKRQLSTHVGIDGFAGPSDLVVVASDDAPPEPLALDLLAQAEHGAGTLVVAISPDRDLLAQLSDLLTSVPDTGAVGRLVQTQDTAQAVALAQAIAPEHLQLVGAEAEALAPRATNAGCLFVGPAAGTAFGDYIAGSNHILPTGGAARFSSGLTPAHFLRSFAQVEIQSPEALAAAAAPLARAEGFELHARSMEARIRENGGDGSQR